MDISGCNTELHFVLSRLLWILAACDKASFCFVKVLWILAGCDTELHFVLSKLLWILAAVTQSFILFCRGCYGY